MSRVEIIRSFYEANMKDGLPDYKILGWESELAQNMRFDALASNLNLNGKKLLDVGCGLGNLLEFLNKQNIKVDYTGVDILESMITRAGQKNQGGRFLHTDIFNENPFEPGTFDVVYSSGIFNLKLGNNTLFLQKALECFFELSCGSIAFNLLHHNSPDKEDLYFYYSPEEILGIIESLDCDVQKVCIIEKYLQNDFTVICHKNIN